MFYRDYFPKAKDYEPGVYKEAHGRAWTGKADAYVKFYMRWGKDKLHWLALITDNMKNHKNPNLPPESDWCHDTLHVCIYPWPFNQGDTTKGCAYKTEYNIGADGKPVITPRQSPLGTVTADGIEFAARETPDGYVYEGAYSLDSLRPLPFEEGAKFRMAMEYHDMDEPVKRYICDGVMWFAGCGNVSGDINLFGQVTLVGGGKGAK